MTRNTSDHGTDDPVVGVLRRAGCVFAEEEAAVLREHAAGAAELDELCARRAAGEPLEHLVGWVRFGDLRLRVGPGVFVPRQRSLLLARIAVAAVRARRSPLVLEAFCGVAPIAATVAAAGLDARLHVIDIDPAALACARQNLPRGSGVHLGDGLSPLPPGLRGHVDVIAAVPPYVPDASVGFLPHEACDHEPRNALVGGPDGLDHILELIRAARDWLCVGGILLVEMNSEQFELVTDRVEHIGHDDLDAIPGADGQTVVARYRRRPIASTAN